MNFRISTSKDTSLEAGGGVFVWGRLLTCISFRELWVIIWSWCVWQRWFWVAPIFQAQLLPRLWSSPNGILNFQFGPCLNLKLDKPVKSHPQARQPLRKPHNPTLSEDLFLGKSLRTCCQRCHLIPQERTSEWKQVTELYSDTTTWFMIQPPSCVYKSHSFTLDCFILRPEPIKGSKLDMAKHVLCPFLFFSRNSEKAKVKKGLICIYIHIRVCYLFLKNIITSLAKVAFSYVSLLNTKEIFSGAPRIFSMQPALGFIFIFYQVTENETKISDIGTSLREFAHS